MTQDQLFEIACIIDNEYRGKRKTFKATKNRSCWYLTTNVCDWASIIHVWERDNKISSIQYINDDVESWTEISPYSWDRIEKYLQTQNITSCHS